LTKEKFYDIILNRKNSTERRANAMARKGRIVRHSIRCDKCGRTMYFEAPVGLPDHNNLYRASWYRCHNCENWAFVRLNRYGGVGMVSYSEEAKRDGLYYGGTDLALRVIANIFSNIFSKKNRNKKNKKNRNRT
jgi:hypothetical protein